MTRNLVYAPGKDKTLPYDLQRHITTKYLTKQERHQYVLDKFNSARGLAEFKKNLSSLPPDTRVKLFVHGIYNKFNNLINTYSYDKDMAYRGNLGIRDIKQGHQGLKTIRRPRRGAERVGSFDICLHILVHSGQ